MHKLKLWREYQIYWTESHHLLCQPVSSLTPVKSWQVPRCKETAEYAFLLHVHRMACRSTMLL